MVLNKKMNANNLKDQGNMFFAARRFNDAVSCYTKAIVSTGLAIVRAQCYSVMVNDTHTRRRRSVTLPICNICLVTQKIVVDRPL